MKAFRQQQQHMTSLMKQQNLQGQKTQKQIHHYSAANQSAQPACGECPNSEHYSERLFNQIQRNFNNKEGSSNLYRSYRHISPAQIERMKNYSNYDNNHSKIRTLNNAYLLNLSI